MQVAARNATTKRKAAWEATPRAPTMNRAMLARLTSFRTRKPRKPQKLGWRARSWLYHGVSYVFGGGSVKIASLGCEGTPNELHRLVHLNHE